MKFVNGELLLETEEEIAIAVQGVQCLQNTSRFALNAVQKALPYKHAMSTPAEMQVERDNLAKLEKANASATGFLDKLHAAKGQ